MVNKVTVVDFRGEQSPPWIRPWFTIPWNVLKNINLKNIAMCWDGPLPNDIQVKKFPRTVRAKRMTICYLSSQLGITHDNAQCFWFAWFLTSMPTISEDRWAQTINGKHQRKPQSNHFFCVDKSAARLSWLDTDDRLFGAVWRTEGQILWQQRRCGNCSQQPASYIFWHTLEHAWHNKPVSVSLMTDKRLRFGGILIGLFFAN